MRHLFLLALVLFTQTVFCQDAEMIKEINKVIGPEFKVSINDTINCDFFDWLHSKVKVCNCIENNNSYNKYKKQKVVVVANNAIKKYRYEPNLQSKIFVLEKTKNKFQIIDSSTAFCFAKGANVEIKNDTIILNSLVHGEGFSSIYVYNKRYHQYFLQKIKYFETFINGSAQNILEEYDLNTQKLKVVLKILTSKNSIWETSKQKTKIYNKKLPEDLKIKLFQYINPYEKSIYNNIYSKIFIFYPNLQYKKWNKFFEQKKSRLI